MSFEAKVQAELNLGTTSKSALIRKAREVGMFALIDRVDAMSMRKSIDQSKNKDGTPMEASVKAAGKRHALRTYIEKNNAGLKMLADAEADIARNTPPLPQAEGAGPASIDSELRAAFKALPEAQRLSLKVPKEMLMAVSRGPAILSNIPENMHERLVDGIRRQMWPERMAELDNDRRVVEAARTALQMHRETAATSLGVEAHPSVTQRIVAA